MAGRIIRVLAVHFPLYTLCSFCPCSGWVAKGWLPLYRHQRAQFPDYLGRSETDILATPIQH